MKNLYLINFLGGTAGNFLLQLLTYIVDTKALPIRLSANGGAHDYTSLTRNVPNTAKYREVIGIEPVYKHVDTRAIDWLPKDTLFMVDHLPPNWDDLFTLYPECKNIIITLPPHMSLRLAGNMFYKTICGFEDDNALNAAWQTMRSTDEQLRQYTYPEEVPYQLLESSFRSFADTYSNYIISPYNASPIPEQYKDQICYISYRDIIHDMDKVLGQLKDFTGLELPEGIRDSYQMYLDAQAELVKTKMPWVDDKYPYE
jgi:hypothetical protein